MSAPGEGSRSATLNLAEIRHPREHVVLALSAAANVAVVAVAAAVVYLAPEWAAGHGRVTALVQRLRLAVIAAILILPFVSLLRLGRWASFRENSIQLGREQVPAIFAVLDRLCRVAGIDPPELYASAMGGVGISTALALGGRRIIVLGQDVFQGLERIEDRADVLEFVLGYELGRLVLGHASWWEDLLLGYLKRIPVLRLPLITVQTASRDRFAATLSPGSIRGLVLLAAGGDLLDHVDAAAFVEQILRDPTPARWAWVGKLERGGPHLAARIRALSRAGLLRAPALGAARTS